MTDVVLVRPRHGLILDGIPSKGAEVPRALAEEWIANRLVEQVGVKPIENPRETATKSPSHVQETPAKPTGNPTPKRRSTK
jgi:hypothetical protein